MSVTTHIIKSDLTIVIGDTHRNHNYIINKIKHLKLENTTFIHVGDFGVGFISEEKDILLLTYLNDCLKEHNSFMYVIRGNHDNPKYFNGEWSNIFSNLFLVEDYTILNINDENYLLAGGAISIDRMDRLKNTHEISYWKDEFFTLREDLLKEMYNITYVITHSSPGFVKPFNYTHNSHMSHGLSIENYSKNDKELKNDINKERYDITKMYNLLKVNNNIKKWYFGHYHKSNREVYENTIFYTLDIGEFMEVK